MRVQPFANPMMNRPALKPQSVQFGQVTEDDIKALRPGSIVTFEKDGQPVQYRILSIEAVKPRLWHSGKSLIKQLIGFEPLFSTITDPTQYLFTAREVGLSDLVEPQQGVILAAKTEPRVHIIFYQGESMESGKLYFLSDVTHPED